MTQEELQAIRERCENAQSGLWEVTQLSDQEVYVTVGYTYTNGIHRANWIATMDDDDEATTTEERMNNAEFIAHARTDLPKALDEIERQAKEIERFRGALEEIEGTLEGCHNWPTSDAYKIARQALGDDE